MNIFRLLKKKNLPIPGHSAEQSNRPCEALKNFPLLL